MRCPRLHLKAAQRRMVTFPVDHEFPAGNSPSAVCNRRILHGEPFRDGFAKVSRHRTILAGIGALRTHLASVSAAIFSFATDRLSPGRTFVRQSVICLQADKGNSRSIPVYPAKPGFCGKSASNHAAFSTLSRCTGMSPGRCEARFAGIAPDAGGSLLASRFDCMSPLSSFPSRPRFCAPDRARAPGQPRRRGAFSRSSRIAAPSCASKERVAPWFWRIGPTMVITRRSAARSPARRGRSCSMSAPARRSTSASRFMVHPACRWR